MKKEVVKLAFSTPIHYGNNNKPGLLSTGNYILSDTLYSALIDNNPTILNKLVELVNKKKIALSDMLPYVEEELLVPKGNNQIDFNNDSIDRTFMKKAKKINFISLKNYSNYYKNLSKEIIEDAVLLESKIGEFGIRTNNQIKRDFDKETEPYILSTFTFYEKSGLYLFIEYDDINDLNFIKEELRSLGVSGIGGRRSSGFGKFTIKESSNYDESKVGKYLLLSTTITPPDNMSGFEIIKRSGFYHSSDGFFKKRDLYAIKSGLLLDNKTEGIILDNLSNMQKIYRFFIPLYVRINLWILKIIH